MSLNIPHRELENFFNEGQKIVLIGHFNPDGDAIGSLVGMYWFLTEQGKDVTIISPNRFPAFLKFLEPEARPILVYTKDPQQALDCIENADLLICQDFNRLSRSEALADPIKASGAHKILIDHHPAPESEWFDIVVSNTNVSSTCELVFHTLMSLSVTEGKVENLSLQCAEALYSGLLTDTNNFANSLFPDTLTTASSLMARGVNSKEIYYKLFCPYTESRMRLMGKMLQSNLTVLKELGAAYMLLSIEDKLAFCFQDGDSEGFVNLPLAINGIGMTALFTQEKDFIRVSLRSKGDIDVNGFARRYCNGGGHINASGGRLYDIPWEQVPAFFERALAEYQKGTTFVN